VQSVARQTGFQCKALQDKPASSAKRCKTTRLPVQSVARQTHGLGIGKLSFRRLRLQHDPIQRFNVELVLVGS
jgi:hypothetical protein